MQRQSLLATRIGPRKKPPERSLCSLVAAGALAHSGRQGPRSLDALRQQRARAGKGILEELLHRPRGRGAAASRHWLLLPAVAGGLRRKRRGRRGPAPRRLSDPPGRPAGFPVLERGRLAVVGEVVCVS